MTLQKQTLLSTHALVLAAVMYVSSANNLASGNVGYESRSRNDLETGVGLRQVVEIERATDDSTQKPNVVDKLARPPIRMNAGAVKFVKQFIKKNEEDLQKTEKRSTGLFNIIEPILAQYDIPKQLKYLAVIESNLKLNARSHAGAVGLWQLMSQTARELGLTVSGKVDERKNSYRSTKAAAKYLRALYKEYGDWLLVIAAYNSGPGVVNAAIKKSGSRNFWKLQSFLPGETRAHVKRYIAVHYFFEEVGSETTLTKAENTHYTKELLEYNCVIEELSKAKDTTVTVATNLITNQEVANK